MKGNIDKNRNSLQIYLVAIIAATGGLLFGFDTGVISGAIPFFQKDFGINDMVVETITTSGLLGAIAGALFCGKITDYFGRKKVILFSAIIFSFGAVWSGIALDPQNLILARFFLGIAIGISSFAVPLYIAEVSPTNIRGRLVSMFQLMITLGILISYLSDLYFADENNVSCWRTMFYVGVIPGLVLLTGMLFLPESPRWLISRGFNEKAIPILKQIEGDEVAEKIVMEVGNEIEKSKKESFKIIELLKPPHRTPLFVAVGVMFFQQFIGINTVIYYSPKIFFMAGFATTVSTIWASVGIGIVNALATIISIYYIDKLGRRKLYFLGMAGMVLSLIALTIGFISINQMGNWGQWLILIFMFLYVAFFALSIGPLGWLIVSEVFPQKIRGLGSSIGSLSVWFFNSVVTFTFFKIINAFHFPGLEIVAGNEIVENPAGAFAFYCIIAILALLWGYFYIPETKGVSLEKIEEFWKKGKKPIDL